VRIPTVYEYAQLLFIVTFADAALSILAFPSWQSQAKLHSSEDLPARRPVRRSLDEVGSPTGEDLPARRSPTGEDWRYLVEQFHNGQIEFDFSFELIQRVITELNL
jgi:hypothetical protein